MGCCRRAMHTYMYIYTYTHTYMYVCTYIYKKMYIYPHIHTHNIPRETTPGETTLVSCHIIYTYMHTHIHTYTYIYTHTHTQMCIHTQVHNQNTQVHIQNTAGDYSKGNRGCPGEAVVDVQCVAARWYVFV